MNTESQKAEEFKQHGNKAFKEGNYPKAIEWYSKAIDANPMEPSYYANRAACYLGLKKFQKCIQDCDDTLAIDPKFTKALRRKARSLYCLGRFKEAKENFEKTIRIDPKDTTLKDELREVKMVETVALSIESHYEQGKYTEALVEIDRALGICNDLNFLKIKQVDCLAKTGHADKAVQIANQILSENANNPDFLFIRAMALNYNGQSELAKKSLQEALRMDPDNNRLKLALKKINKQEDLKERGNIAFKNGKLDEAIRIYTEAVELDPFNKNLNAILYANRAAANLKLKKLQDALRDCNKAIELNDKYIKAYTRRGEIRMDMGDYEEAVRDFQQIRQLDPSNHHITQRLHEAQQKAKKASRKDYYKILGIEKAATEKELKTAYKKLALKWHPDKHTADTEDEKAVADKMFRDISEAYAVLSDKQKRQQYDVGADMEDGFQGFNGGAESNVDPNVIFRTFFGGDGDFGGFSMGGGRGGNMGGGFPSSFFSSSGGSSGGFPGFGGAQAGGMPGGMKFKFSSNKR